MKRSAVALDTLEGRLAAVSDILGLGTLPLEAHPKGAPLAQMMREMEADGACPGDPSREIFSRLGDKWSTLLILILRAGAARHGRLLRLSSTVGMDRSMTQRMLTLRLKSLEADGFVTRTVLSEKPLAVEYALSDLGEEFAAVIEGLLGWIRRNAQTIRLARAAFETRPAGSGQWGEPRRTPRQPKPYGSQAIGV